MGEPSEILAPPKKRRRWLIVAFFLVLLSTVSWWCWPRGDARFVGKWRMLDERGTDMGGEVQLRSNGVWRGVHPPNTLWTLWSVEGDRFQIGNPRDAFGAAWLRKLSEIVSKGRTLKLVLGYGSRYRIESITPAEIQLIREPDGYRTKLVRVVE